MTPADDLLNWLFNNIFWSIDSVIWEEKKTDKQVLYENLWIKEKSKRKKNKYYKLYFKNKNSKDSLLPILMVWLAGSIISKIIKHDRNTK